MLLLFYAESASRTTLWQANPGLILIFYNKHLIAAPMNYFSQLITESITHSPHSSHMNKTTTKNLPENKLSGTDTNALITFWNDYIF